MGKLSSKAWPTVDQRRVDLCAVKRVDAPIRSRRPVEIANQCFETKRFAASVRHRFLRRVQSA